VNLATAGRGLLHEGPAAGLVSADVASTLKALEVFGATPTILDVCILSVWFRTAIRRSGLSGAGSAFDRSERPADEVCQPRESEDHPFAVPPFRLAQNPNLLRSDRPTRRKYTRS
jgi:hypothetical protein